MASSDYDFNITRNDIVRAALRKIGAGAQDAPASSSQLTEAVQTLNVMVKSWQSQGVFLWTESWKKIDMVASTAEYVLATAFTDANIFNIRSAYLRQGGDTDLAVDIITQEQYAAIPDKTVTGRPYSLVFNRDLTPSVTLYPVPSDSTYDLYLLCESKLKDFDSTTGNPDFPSNWMNALIYGLAAELADEYMIPLPERQWIRSLAGRYFIMAKQKSNSERSTYNYLEPSY